MMGQAGPGAAGLTVSDHAQLGLLADCRRLAVPGVRVTRGSGRLVYAGARGGALAQAGEVLVTSTVQMLVLGSGIGFARLGRGSLSGVPDPWELFAVVQA